MDDRTQAPPQPQNPPSRTSAQHRAAAGKARNRARWRRGSMRVAVVGATLFIAVFSLLSFRMYVGLDPLLGNQGRTQTTALSETVSEELKELEEELFEEDEDEDDSESSASTSSGSLTDQQSPMTTTPPPTTRAS